MANRGASTGVFVMAKESAALLNIELHDEQAECADPILAPAYRPSAQVPANDENAEAAE